MRNAILAAALCALVLAPAAQAGDRQSPPTIESVASFAGPFPYAGSANTTVTVGVGCVAALQAVAASSDRSATMTVQVDNASEWLTVAPVAAVFDTTLCPTATDQYLTTSVQLTYTVSPEAPGVLPQTVLVNGSMPGLNNAVQSATAVAQSFNVSFHGNYTVTPSIQFPADLDGRYLNFTVDIQNAGNAPSMVMVASQGASTGHFSGLESLSYSPPETKRFNVSFEAPSGEWTEARIMFHTYTHYLLEDGQAGGTSLAMDTTWVVRNTNPGGTTNGDETSPISFVLLLPALALAALVAARRRTL